MSLLDNPVTFTSRINPDLVRGDGSVVVANFEKREQDRRKAGQTLVPVGGKNIQAAKLTPGNIGAMSQDEVRALREMFKKDAAFRAALLDDVVIALSEKQ
ncbi:MAG: hypothetical protein VW518_08115 [Burkholderiaceae bacterium]